MTDRFIDTIAYAGLENNTGYTFLCQTELSEKLDEIFGFDKYRHYALMSRGVKEAYDILIVESQPVRGLTGEIQIPVSREVLLRQEAYSGHRLRRRENIIYQRHYWMPISSEGGSQELCGP